MFSRLLNSVLYLLSGLWPRRRNRVVFGAWMGHKYGDNPRYLFEHLLTHHQSEFDLIWIGRPNLRDELPEGAKFVPYGSLAAVRAVLSAAHGFVDHGYRDVCSFNLLNRAHLIYLGHGLTIKHMGAPPQTSKSFWRRWAKGFLALSNRFDRFVAASEEHADKQLREFSAHDIAPEKMLLTGQPRNDFLVNDDGTIARKVRIQYQEELGIPVEKRLITYMPTFRDNRGDVFSFSRMSPEGAKRLLELLRKYDACIAEKKHPVDSVIREGGTERGAEWIHDIGRAPGVDSQELLLVTDILVTDYSGCYLDYVLMDRPVVHFAYDYEYYKNQDRGLYYPLEKVAGGPLVTDEDQLLDALESALSDRTTGHQERAKLKEWMLTEECGRACARIAESVLGVTPASVSISVPGSDL